MIVLLEQVGWLKMMGNSLEWLLLASTADEKSFVYSRKCRQSDLNRFVHITASLLLLDILDSKATCPDFSQYLYFLFAPTLICRDQYPRNTTIQWDFVLKMFGQVLACMLYVYYIVVRFCIPTYENLNQNQITLPIFISVLFSFIMPGSLFLLWGFYGFLHCWLNAFAEMLRFADQMFYKVRREHLWYLGLVDVNIFRSVLSNLECCDA